MPDSVLVTKLHKPPSRTGIVQRPRLSDRLDAALQKSLTLISAPAGFGKTTLLSEWIRQRGVTAAWLSLDRDDNDAARFVSYLTAALQTIEPDVGKGLLEALRSPQPPPVESILTALINDVAETSAGSLPGGDFVLILDDYHVIEAQSAHEALTFLLDHLPPRMHLVIATRADPPLPLARLRGRGQLTELRAADLRFSPDEAAEFLNRVMALDLSLKDVHALADRTEGWVAGLQMAAVSMQGREDISGFIQAFTGSNRYVLDYLIEEVLEHQPENVQAFLLQTSILDRLTGPLCDVLTGQQGGGLMLNQLQRANLFIIPLDDEGLWYQYHHLFADLLRQRLGQNQPDLVPKLHRRASEWHEKNGQVEEAIDHALNAQDFERAASLIEQVLGKTLWKQGEQTAILRWMEALPNEIVCLRPRLCIFHATVLSMAGQPDQAEARLQAAERILSGDASDELARTEQMGMVSTVRAYIAYFRGNRLACIEHAQQALDLLPQHNSMWRSSAAIALGDAYTLSDQLVTAQQVYLEALRASRSERNNFLILLAGSKLAAAHGQLGQLGRAADLCEELVLLVGDSGLSETMITGRVFAIWGNILCEWHELDRAEAYLQKAVGLSQREGNVAALGLSYLYLLRLLFARHDLSGVEATLNQLERLAQISSLPMWIANGIIAWKAWIWITQGKLEAAAQLLQEYEVTVDGDPGFGREGEYLSRARLLLAQGSAIEAGLLLDRFFATVQSKALHGWMIASLTLRAQAFEAQGLREPAITTLRDALSLGESEGYIQVFAEEGAPLAHLLYKASGQGIAPQYVGRLLAAFSLEPSEPRDIPQQTAKIAEPLSGRELEVLRLLIDGLSNQEIAKRLVIALPTVKWHTGNIYGKLGVSSRTQAVARARALGLLME